MALFDRKQWHGQTEIATNQPDSVQLAGGGAIKYLYTADRQRIGMKIYAPSATEASLDFRYIGGYTYLNGQPFTLHHAEGRLVYRDSSRWVYEYDLRDHLGNTRVSFTTEPATEQFMATMEAEHAEYEEASFMMLEESRMATSSSIDHTGVTESPQVSRLNGGRGIKDGPAKMLRVMPGDTVRMQVYAKYLDISQMKENVQPMMLPQMLMQAQGLPAAGDMAGQMHAKQGLRQLFAMIGKPIKDEAPKAFLNYQLFDNTFNQRHAGFARVSKAAAITEEQPDGEHELLELEVVIDKPGYLFTYLSHEEEEDVEIYFDDYSVTHSHGYITQVQDYYPYGMVHSQVLVDNELLNRYLYQGKEYEDSLGVYDFHARMYEPSIGRFLRVDPQLQFASPYLAMGNNPVMYVDPDGEWVHIAVGAAVGGLVNLGVKIYQGKVNFDDGIGKGLLDGAVAFGIGAAAGALGAATGGAAFAAAGGAAAGTGGFLAGAAGGMAGAAVSTPIQSYGNHLYFGDDMITMKQYLIGVAAGGVLGGAINGGVALYNGKTFMTGITKPQPVEIMKIPDLQIPKTPAPEQKPSFSKLKELPQQKQQVFDKIIDGDNVRIRYDDFAGKTVNSNVEEASNVVYRGIDASGKVRYVGITKRTPTIRFDEHLNSIGTGKEFLRYEVIEGASGLTRTGARIWEQTLINQYGLGRNGGQLLNKVNSIAPKYWWQYGIK